MKLSVDSVIPGQLTLAMTQSIKFRLRSLAWTNTEH